MAVRLQTIEKFALALPGVVAAPHFNLGSWRVVNKAGKAGKIFVTVPPGEAVLHVFLPEAAREEALLLYPECVEKLFWGSKVCGVRVLLAKAGAAQVKHWVEQAWAHHGGGKLRP